MSFRRAMSAISYDVWDVDVLGIGFGPSNLSLAIVFEEWEVPFVARFLDRSPDSQWQRNMLLNGSDIQNNPLRDLVTPRNPQSNYSFVNYLHKNGRFFDYLNLGLMYPLRREYSRYIEWSAKHFLDGVDYNQSVRQIHLHQTIGSPARWLVETDERAYRARCIVLGTGRTPHIPEVFRPLLGRHVFHLNYYLEQVRHLPSDTTHAIGVIGASQSAVEILLDLMVRFPNAQIHSIHRSYAMRQKDTSPFSDHVYFPEFTNYFFAAPTASKRELEDELRTTNYKSADADVLHTLYLKIYEERLEGRHRFHLHKNSIVATAMTENGRCQLHLLERHTGTREMVTVDNLVLATGFKDLGIGEAREPFPTILADVAAHLAQDENGVLRLARDYSVDTDCGPLLYLNGLCESSHGLGDAGSFSLLSLRAADIARSILQKLGVADRPSPHAAPVIDLQDATGRP